MVGVVLPRPVSAELVLVTRLGIRARVRALVGAETAREAGAILLVERFHQIASPLANHHEGDLRGNGSQEGGKEARRKKGRT